jgi:hypothetical protein
VEGEVIVRESERELGYNAMADKHENLVEAGTVEELDSVIGWLVRW